ncbi:MAG: ABC transporter ATP-binding protein [Clostridia bacterium]|nr:ABC transporter ATP-binding protein [Clostridia bacterium]
MKKNKSSLLKRVVLRHGPMFAAAVISMFAAVGMDFLTPMIFAQSIDSVLSQNKPLSLPYPVSIWVERLGGREFLAGNLWIIALSILLAYMLAGACQYLRGRFIARASEAASREIRDELYGHIIKLPFDRLERSSAGDLIQRCTSDVETIRRFLSNQIIEIFRAVFMLIVALLVLARINASLCLISVALAPFLCGFSFFFYGLVRRRFAKADAAEGSMSSVLQENLAAVRVVRAFGRQGYEMDKFEKANGELHAKSKSLSDLLAIYWATGDAISALQTGITLVMAVVYAARGELLAGEATVFVSYVSMLMWPVRQLGRILADMGKAKVAAGRLEQILEMPVEDMTSGGLKPPLDGDVVFDGVYFGYGGKDVLSGLSFTVPAGATVGVLGATGSGKSTIMRLLDRLYEPSSGRITIGGTDIKLIDKAYLRSRVAFIAQEAYLYSRTARDNIAFARRDASGEDIDRAARVSRCDEFISRFESGMDTMVGERGVTLSGGQAQRIAIARAILTDASILIFDDSLSAVDTRTDRAIRKELDAVRGKATTFIISHRLSTLCECDFTIVLEGGKAAEIGKHDELIRSGGLYSRLYRIERDLEDEMRQTDSGGSDDAKI